MITTRRETTSEEMTRSEARSRLGLLERTEPRSFNEAFEAPVQTEEEQNERMTKNFDMLLNYEKYIEEAKQKEMEEERIRTERVAAENAAREAEVAARAAAAAAVRQAEPVVEEDITPSGTTMQFRTENVGELYNDLEREKEDTRQNAKYRINARGKLLAAIYAIVVVTILALIIINTSVLAALRGNNAANAALLAEKQAEYADIAAENEYLSSDDYISSAAEDLGMVK